MCDPETFELFSASNFDAYDRERYPAPLREGLAHHGLQLSDVLAVTQDFGCWVLCRTGIFRVGLRGMFKKRTEIDAFIAYAAIESYRVEPSGPHSRRLVFIGRDGKEVARIDFSAAGMETTPAMAAAQCDRIRAVIDAATR